MSASDSTKVVDIVKDAINLLPIYWAANCVVRPNVGRLSDVIYSRASLVCRSPILTMFWEDTQLSSGLNYLLT